MLRPLATFVRAGSSIVTVGLEGAAEAANTRALVAELSLLKPNVTNPKLAEIVDDLFQPTDRLPGGTAGAVRWERRTGEMLSPKGHFQDAADIINRLDKFLKNNAGISRNDQGVAKEPIRDLQNALSGK